MDGGAGPSFPNARCKAVGSGGPLVVPLNTLLKVHKHEIILNFFWTENILYFTLKEFHLVSLVLEIMNFLKFRQVTQLCLALASILPA
jgi:hypothetical protein